MANCYQQAQKDAAVLSKDKTKLIKLLKTNNINDYLLRQIAKLLNIARDPKHNSYEQLKQKMLAILTNDYKSSVVKHKIAKSFKPNIHSNNQLYKKYNKRAETQAKQLVKNKIELINKINFINQLQCRYIAKELGLVIPAYQTINDLRKLIAKALI